ncbi:hypothetical protein XbrCFBP1976_00340 [Xanthomonas bromi]|uniref:Uncharacterized protein n=1 Tax=Xanthomonas bromi TaxID=56449 RepID=A0ABX5BWB9_9XANT|nr:hypothetical protein XbrCFBP1976_00340 [Xanthomonas bromi]
MPGFSHSADEAWPRPRQFVNATGNLLLHLLGGRNAERGLPGLAVGSAQSPSQGDLVAPEKPR